VAVVDDTGKLVGAMSHSDLKLIQADARMFWRLHQTVKNFLQKNRKEGYERPTHPITASPTETIETALRKFQENHVHRIFIVDDNHKPTGIVTLKDILAAFVDA
jgi:CBS domain-containing protein